VSFAAYPAPFIRETPTGTKRQQLIWGDFVSRLNEDDGEWTKVRSRGQTGWIKKTELQEERLLEVNFVDIGQGDGAFLVTPAGAFMLIDAGESDSMFRFLSWRFNLRSEPDRRIEIPTAVITHSDQDHYKGYAQLFASPQLTFGTIFHNGIVERAGADLLGPRIERQGDKFLTDLISDLPTLAARLADPAFVGGKQYPKMLKSGLATGRIADVRAVSASDGFLPGFAPPGDFTIEAVGPARDTVDGQQTLRWFTDDGKTKNGHSVSLRMRYRHVRIFFGGDLNIPSAEHLLRHHTGLSPTPTTAAEGDALVAAARPKLEADIAKACHHGSADFTEFFLRALNPLATVISSGDDEPFAHPRPDALGAYGKYGRGPRPLVFSTELGRSANENIKDPHKLRAEIADLFAQREAAPPETRPAIQARIDACLAKLERSIAVYGLVNLRTDGHKVLLAQKLERPRTATHEEFDVHLLEPDSSGQLRYLPKH
jgi:beta-lactamase superfamily II metal-dependent hydrolase